MKTVRAVPGAVLSLGREGENAARKIEFDLAVWQAEFGAYVGFSLGSIYAKITDAPTITSE